VPLSDDPVVLRGPGGFARWINRQEDLDVEAARRRIPGLLTFARTFIGEIFEKEFATRISGFPYPARTKAAALSVRLREDKQAQLLVMCVIDICDLEIDQEDEDEEAYLNAILELVERLLARFAEWVDESRLPLLHAEAVKVSEEFEMAAERLR
jgi:hypothetical protein